MDERLILIMNRYGRNLESRIIKLCEELDELHDAASDYILGHGPLSDV